MTQIQVTLPDELAKAARNAGLLAPAAFEAMIREQLRARALGELDAALARTPANGNAPMTAEEIQAEIAAYRAERQRAAGS